MTSKNTHGGSREGAGRKPLYDEPMVRINLVLDSETIRKARALGGSVSAGIRRALAAITVRSKSDGEER